MLGQLVGDRRRPSRARAGRRAAGSAAAGSAASRRRARRCRSAGGRRRRGTPRSRISARISSAFACHSSASSSMPAPRGQAGAAVDRDPDHQLRGDVVLRLAARLPDPLVGLVPGGDRRFDLVGEHRLAVGSGMPVRARLFVQVDRVEQRAPDVVLALVVGAVADPHRAARRRSRRGGRASLSVSSFSPPIPYMICSRAVLVAQMSTTKRMKSRASWSKPSVCSAQRREGRVADPAVAVVPVAFAARRLGQRGGRRGDDRAGRRVGEALEHERRALQVDAPGVVGEVAVGQPACARSGACGRGIPRPARPCAGRRAPPSRSSRRSASRLRASCGGRARGCPRCPADVAEQPEGGRARRVASSMQTPSSPLAARPPSSAGVAP